MEGSYKTIRMKLVKPLVFTGLSLLSVIGCLRTDEAEYIARRDYEKMQAEQKELVEEKDSYLEKSELGSDSLLKLNKD